MKLRLRIFLTLACLLLALPVQAGRAQTPNAITEEKVLAVIAAMDKAARAAKADDIIAHLADDVRFKLDVEAAGVKQEIELDREKFVFHTRRAFSKRMAYECKRHKTDVTISKDGQSAMVTSELFEKVSRREGTMSSMSSEVYVLKLRGGRVVVSSYYASVRVLL